MALPKKVFVSSTIEDLRNERKAVEESIGREEGHQYVGAERFGSQPYPPKKVSLHELINCEVYIGIFGNRYGSTLLGDDRSITELEYRKAKEIDIPCLIYFKSEEAVFDTNSGSEALESSDNLIKLREFKKELKRDNTISWFKDPLDLATKVVTDLPRLEQWEAIKNTNQYYYSTLKNNHIKGKTIPRREANIIVSNLMSSDTNPDVLLIGEGGIGKSGIILQVIKTLEKQDCHFLAFRVDSPPVTTPKFGGRLDLCGFSVRILAEAAQGQRCVIILDQLDSLGLASSRTPELANCIDEIIKQVRVHPNMRLLIACKQFDLENDEQLVDLAARHHLINRIVAERLPPEIVSEFLQEEGYHMNLSRDQLQLLSLPLHLKLLLEGANGHLNISLINDPSYLFKKLWEHKNGRLREHGCSDEKFIVVIDTIIDYFIRNQVLFIPAPKLDAHKYCAQAMASENILISEGTYYTFFHESFFNYAFARRLFGESDELVLHLERGGQTIFQHSLIQYLLLYERDLDFDLYLRDAATLLNNPDVRFHLKHIVFATLGLLESPKEEEWNLIAPFIYNLNDPRSEHAWRILYASGSWFALLDSLGVIGQWLNSQNEALLFRVTILLSHIQPRQPQRVAQLLDPYVAASEAWHKRLKRIIIYANLYIERNFFNLFLKMIDIGAYDEDMTTASDHFWYLINDLSKERPEWACESIGHYFNRTLKVSLDVGQPNPFEYGTSTMSHDPNIGQILLRSAKGNPAKFISEVLPFMLEVLQGTTGQGGNASLYDPVWGFRHYGGGFGIEDALLSAMETAIRRIASDEPPQFRDLVNKLKQYNLNTVHYLLIRGYAANGKDLADESIDYLCEDPIRLDTGYFEKSYWATHELLEVVTPYCTDERLLMLEHTLVTHYPIYERSLRGRYSRGHAQFVLLDGIIPSRRSVAVAQRMRRLTRKFGVRALEPPSKIKCDFLKSPIPEEKAAVMTNEEWIAAINRYNSDNSLFSFKDDFIGAARELSYELETQVEKDPDRFANLACLFPENVHYAYIEAVLRGIAHSKAAVDAEAVFNVCRYCHRLPSRPFGRWIPGALARVRDAVIPLEILDIVIWYATNDLDPTTSEYNKEAYNNNLYIAGINSVRGAGSLAIANLISFDNNRPPHSRCLPYFMPAIEKICLDSSIAVRSCGAEILVEMLPYDPEAAITYFFQLLETEQDILLLAHSVRLFLQRAIRINLDKITPILQRMMQSSLPDVAEAGAEHACDVALFIHESDPLIHQCLSGTAAQRLGVANVCSQYLRKTQFRGSCENALIQLFNDTDENVRSRASNCFMYFKDAELSQETKLIGAFLHSPAFSSNHYILIHALEQTAYQLPDITLDICTRFLDVAGEEVKDPTMRAFATGVTARDLAIRGYKENKTNKIMQQHYNDLIDRMLQMGIYGMEKKVMELSDFKQYNKRL